MVSLAGNLAVGQWTGKIQPNGGMIKHQGENGRVADIESGEVAHDNGGAG